MPTADEILAGWYDAESRRLTELMLHPNGRNDPARQFSQARAAQLIAEVRRIQRDLKVRATAVVGPTIGNAYRAGRTDAEAQLSSAGIKAPGDAFPGSFNLVDREALKIIATDTAGDLHKAADSMAETAVATLRRTAQRKLSEADINEIVARGILHGDPRAAERELREALIKAHGGKLVTAGSMTFKAGYYARMVIITKTRQAVVAGAINRFRASGVFLVAITGKQSKNFCTAFLDKVFNIGDGQHPRYPHYNSLPSGGPPFHPNCSKGVRAFIEDMASPAQIEAAKGAPDADKLLNPLAPSTAPTPSAPTRASRLSLAEVQRRFQSLQMGQRVKSLQEKLRRGTSSPEQPVASFKSFSEDADANHDWSLRHWLIPKVTPVEKQALRDYQADGYRSLNKRLRTVGQGGLNDAQRRVAESLDRVIAASRVPEPIIVHRGSNLTDREIDGVRRTFAAKLNWRDKAYGSATLRPDKALVYAEGRAVPVIWEIRVPGGTKALYVSGVTANRPHENEVLFSRGAWLRILSVGEATIMGRRGLRILAEAIP